MFSLWLAQNARIVNVKYELKNEYKDEYEDKVKSSI